jgi:hypothetical protein
VKTTVTNPGRAGNPLPAGRSSTSHHRRARRSGPDWQIAPCLVALLFLLALTAPVKGQTNAPPSTNNLVSNGGFETGNFSNWILTGDTSSALVGGTGPRIPNPYQINPHSGTYEADLATSYTFGYLSQSLSTTNASPGYLLSFWVNNSFGDPNTFQVSWNGSIVYGPTNFPASDWVNIQLPVTATKSSTVLQFGFDDEFGDALGLDDVTVVSVATNVPPGTGAVAGVAFADSIDFTLNTLVPAPPMGGVAYADSTDFTLNTGVPSPPMGGVAYADSSDFTLNTLIPAPLMAGVAYADSSDFTLNTGVTLSGLAGVAYADSSDFTLNTGMTLSGLAGVAYADSTDFTLNTLNSVVSSLPHFTSISVSGRTLTIQAVNGTASGQYVLLGTTNLAGPWRTILTNNYDGSGSLNLIATNLINPAAPQQFYMLKQ